MLYKIDFIEINIIQRDYGASPMIAKCVSPTSEYGRMSQTVCSGEVRAGHELLARSRRPWLIVALPARLRLTSLDVHLQGEIILNVVQHCILFQ